MTKPTLVSLFAGAGGLDIGFHKAGFETIWANEYDKTIAPSFINYFPQTKFDGRSILKVPSADIPKTVTGVIGGPPCQSWSEAGARRGINDPRGQLFHEYIRVIRHCKPKFFVAENVHGIIHSRNRMSFESIVKMFNGEGYTVSWALLKASHYGVPQDRERVFIVGYHESLGKKFTFPDPDPNVKTLKDAIYDLRNLKTGSKKITNHDLTTSTFSPIYMSRNRVRSWSEPSFTILATERHIPLHPQAPKMVTLGPDKKGFVEGSEHLYRRLTVRECARIQTFPDDYEFIYTHPRNGYKMIGNAVPVEMARRIAEKIMEDLSTEKKLRETTAQTELI